ncbi:uncharacterized protein LOC128199399 [Bicyclus anynana]|uniref:Uncharacterized protein LOC128199399 n=1 Tax=Bicyclus anynana TaxID=110368 RepID=A0ABM3M025_BICAN|nr:uncharacterized protein LOC128199399 [Bicyclus anynana]
MRPCVRKAIATTAFILIHQLVQKKKRKKSKHFWIKTLYKNRFQAGNRIFEELCFDDAESNFTRMNKIEFEHLYSLINAKISKKDTNFREAITARERLLVTLRFLATGDSYTSLQYLFRISKQRISVIVHEVCDALIDVLRDYVKIPSSEEEWLTIAREFETKWNFPHAIAAMDGKHVILQSPINSGNDFDCYKLFPSIVLFALVDANYKFLYVDVGSKGRISDGGVFKNTNLYKKLEKRELNIPPPEILQIPYETAVPYFILADKAFALDEYTMKPYEGTPNRGSMERIFNYRLSRARRVVENAFGILSSVFRVLRKPILLEPEKATKVVLTTIYLYNYLRRDQEASQRFTAPGSFDVEAEGTIIPGRWRQDTEMSSMLPIRAMPRRGPTDLKEIRSHLGRHFITNGAIAWQNNYQ